MVGYGLGGLAQPACLLWLAFGKLIFLNSYDRRHGFGCGIG